MRAALPKKLGLDKIGAYSVRRIAKKANFELCKPGDTFRQIWSNPESAAKNIAASTARLMQQLKNPEFRARSREAVRLRHARALLNRIDALLNGGIVETPAEQPAPPQNGKKPNAQQPQRARTPPRLI